MTASQYNLLSRMATNSYYIAWWRPGFNGGTWRLFTPDGDLIPHGSVSPATKTALVRECWVDQRFNPDRLVVNPTGLSALHAHRRQFEARRAKLKGAN